MLASFDWEILGPSNKQGGDPLDRFVVHAKHWSGQNPNRPRHRVCLVEYAQALALSCETIVEQQPAFNLVKVLSGFSKDRQKPLSEILENPDLLRAFCLDLTISLSNHCNELDVRWPAGLSKQDNFSVAMQEHGVKVWYLGEQL
jgi:hypothetical protein